MVVVHSDNQMFYNTSKESMVVGGEKYQEKDGTDRRCNDVSSPNNNEESVPVIRYEGREVLEMGEEPVHPAETRDMERTREEFECPFCPSKFSWRSALMQHQETEHSNEQMFICDQCDKIFTDPSNLQRHIRTQHAGSRSHSCPECGKTFATSSGLKQHTHIHSSIKPFICEVCLKSYTQFSNLCRHKRMHADCRTQLKCSTCGQMYTTITSLNKHRRFCHSASPLISKHLSPTSLPQALQPPSILPYSPPLIGLPPSALYQASLAQMWNANMQQALIAQSLGKTMMPNPYMLGYPPLSTHAPLYSTLNPGGAADSLHEEHKKLIGQFPSSGLKSAFSPDEKDSPKNANDDEEEHSKDDRDLEPQIKRMRVESVSPAASPSRQEGSQPPSPVIDEHTKFPRFIHKPTVSPTGSHPPRIASPANSLGHQEDGRSAFSPPQVSPSSSTKSTEGKSLHRPTEQPLDLTTQKTPSPVSGLPSPISGLPSPVSPLSGSFTSDRLSHLLESKKRRSFLGYSSQLPSSFDPMYKVKMEQQQLAEHYSRSAAITSSLPGLATFPPGNLLGSPQAAFLKYHSLQGGSQFPFGGGVMYPTSSKDMMIRGGKDRYTCKFCGKLFPRSANLTRHLRTHTGEQPYSCKYCDRSFSISSNLQRHVRNIHNKEKPFKCPLCDRCFGQQTNLDRHLKKHDNEQNGEITTTSVRKIDENVEKIGSEKVRDIDGDEKDSSIINPGSPEFLERMASPSSPQRHSEPAQPLKIQYKIARGRSPLSSSSTCQSPRSSKVDSGLASPSEDEEACEVVPTEARNVESSVDRSEAKLHSYPYITTRPSSWDSQGLHKPKAILT